jgi:hypothetical protein
MYDNRCKIRINKGYQQEMAWNYHEICPDEQEQSTEERCDVVLLQGGIENIAGKRLQDIRSNQQEGQTQHCG